MWELESCERLHGNITALLVLLELLYFSVSSVGRPGYHDCCLSVVLSVTLVISGLSGSSVLIGRAVKTQDCGVSSILLLSRVAPKRLLPNKQQ